MTLEVTYDRAALINRTLHTVLKNLTEGGALFAGFSQAFVVPLLEYLDKIGFTKRVGDRRVLATA